MLHPYRGLAVIFCSLCMAAGCASDSSPIEVAAEESLEDAGFSFEQAAKGTVRIEAEGCDSESVGTGVLIDERHVVTVAHVVAGSDQIYVQAESESARATAIGFDEERDLALLRTDSPIGSVYLPLGDFAYQTGDPVSIIGYPLGLEASLVTGVISNDDVTFEDLPLSRFVQVDAPLNPGNSGGPVFNDAGQVIGLVDWKFGDAEGLSFAISTRSIDRIIESWIDNEEVTTGRCPAPEADSTQEQAGPSPSGDPDTSDSSSDTSASPGGEETVPGTTPQTTAPPRTTPPTSTTVAPTTTTSRRDLYPIVDPSTLGPASATLTIDDRIAVGTIFEWSYTIDAGGEVPSFFGTIQTESGTLLCGGEYGRGRQVSWTNNCVNHDYLGNAIIRLGFTTDTDPRNFAGCTRNPRPSATCVIVYEQTVTFFDPAPT